MQKHFFEIQPNLSIVQIYFDDRFYENGVLREDSGVWITNQVLWERILASVDII